MATRGTSRSGSSGAAGRGVIGGRAERRALSFLEARGMKPVARNFRCRLGEIDLVMQDGECLVFVEVRYRSRNRYSKAALTVDARKQAKLLRAAGVFLAAHRDLARMPARFDVIGLDRDAFGRVRIDWRRQAFRAD